MPKNKRPTPRKSAPSPEQQEEALTHSLYTFAVELGKQADSGWLSDAVKSKTLEFQKLIRKCLSQKKDDVLYEALERAQAAAGSAYQLLKASIEESAEIILCRRDPGPDLEINAFVIPIFAHTRGGLDRAQCFQDQQAFELLTQSLQEAQLESQDATVVLVSHAYHLDEIDGISYSQLNEMIRDAFASMTGKKLTATPAIDRSMSGWPEHHFAPEDLAVELRFLLGFTLKSMDDPYYQVPEEEAAADRYFAMRAARFQHWTQQAAPLVQRCLVTQGRDIELDFLYQDLFHGGKERGIAEYHTLEMMAELHHGLQMHGTPPETTEAVIGTVEIDGEIVLRVNLYAASDGALIASSEKLLGVAYDLQSEAEDAYDALMTIGVKSLALAARFDADGQAVDVRPYHP